ncbi:hypothetical protein Gohar_007055, partial [Gossypium harknessii]|nr:hypothetical protein [Gossypium harknessii]
MLLVIRVEIVIWKPLENAFIKINFDGGFQIYSLKSCSRIVIRNQKGVILGSTTIINNYIPTGFTTEAIACRQRRWWRKIDGERLGGVPLDYEMKIGFKNVFDSKSYKGLILGKGNIWEWTFDCVMSFQID